jgi:hypothetical protein
MALFSRWPDSFVLSAKVVFVIIMPWEQCPRQDSVAVIVSSTTSGGGLSIPSSIRPSAPVLLESLGGIYGRILVVAMPVGECLGVMAMAVRRIVATSEN